MGQDPVTVQGGDRRTRTVPRCGRREHGRYDQAATSIRLGTRRERDGRTRRRVGNKMAAEVGEQLGSRLTVGVEEEEEKSNNGGMNGEGKSC